MLNQKLICWIAIFNNYFDSKKIKLFKHHLSRPYLGKKKDVQKLYNLLRKLHPLSEENGNKKVLEKEAIFKKMWPKQTFNDKRLSNIVGLLRKEMEDFYFQHLTINDPLLRNKVLLKQEEIRLSSELLKEKVKKWEDTLDKQARSSQNYYEQMYFHEFKIGYCPRDNFNLATVHLPKFKENLELFHNSYQLKLLCKEVTTGSVFSGTNVNHKKVTNLLEETASYRNENFPLLHLYIECIELATRPLESSSFRQLIQLFKKYTPRLKAVESEAILIILVGFCIRQIYDGNSDYLPYQADLYKWGLSNKILGDGIIMRASSFMNIVIPVTYAGEFDFAEKVIEEYLPKVPPEERAYAKYMALAYIKFGLKEYQKALKLLHLACGNYERYRLRYQYLSLRLLYEIYQTDKSRKPQLLDKIKSYREFFRTKTALNETRRLHSLNLAEAVSKMLKFHQTNTNSKMQHQILQELAALKTVDNLWVNKKVKELKKGRSHP